MTQKIYHGNFTSYDLASFLVMHFNHGNLEVRKTESKKRVIIQIRSKNLAKSGGKTAIGVTLQDYKDGVLVSVGEQKWLGIAASLGYSALTVLKSPISLLNRIDDIAQDIEYLSLDEEIWDVLSINVKAMDGGFQLSERLRRIACSYCQTANSIDAPSCIACGAPLGDLQPITCSACGYVMEQTENICPNCHSFIK
jgi:RNA polymerase subunit RPABC4/transcription elongation factor Spt4